MIVVASFRTESRAARVAGELKELGLPADSRTRSGGWQQVIVGPYDSRDAALRAQQRLEEAFITGSVIEAEPASR